MKEIIMLLIVFVVIVSWIFLLHQFVFKPTKKFYELRTELENEIRTQHNYKQQLEKLAELDKKSWHRSTGEEVNRLASMMEIKYGVKLLKR